MTMPVKLGDVYVMRILSGFKFTFIVLILLPSLVVISHFLVTSVIIQYSKVFQLLQLFNRISNTPS